MPPDNPGKVYGAEDFASATNVSRETLARLQIYASMLEDWNTRHNLVSRASLGEIWQRHFLDSAQLLAFIPPNAKSLIDLGSGAGFPGLVVGVLRNRPSDMRIRLVEATGKKCLFLAAVAERLDLDVDIRQARIEDLAPEPFDVITARACAPLVSLLPYAQRFFRASSRALFLKGKNVDAELTEARKSWRMVEERHPSRSDPSGVILEIRELHRLGSARKQTHR